jgi:hypothetical protein
MGVWPDCRNTLESRNTSVRSAIANINGFRVGQVKRLLSVSRILVERTWSIRDQPKDHQ